MIDGFGADTAICQLPAFIGGTVAEANMCGVGVTEEVPSPVLGDPNPVAQLLVFRCETVCPGGAVLCCAMMQRSMLRCGVVWCGAVCFALVMHCADGVLCILMSSLAAAMASCKDALICCSNTSMHCRPSPHPLRLAD